MPDNYQSLYRKLRPLDFDGIVGQRHIVDTLMHSIERQKVSHAYLFCGQRGTGKTTMARVLAKALNCKDAPTVKPCNQCAACKEISTGSFIDTIEIDAASNRGIDEIRSLRDSAKLVASMGKKKVYIIDEVHMLSIPAFNALLKLLEEPPAHVVFILATTDPHKILQTIISRCQRFDFRPISEEDIKSYLARVAKKENISITEEALEAITKASTGSLRDALSILEQLSSLGKGEITRETAETALGSTAQDILLRAVDVINSGSPVSIVDFVFHLVKNGINLPQFLGDMTVHTRNLVLLAYAGSTIDVDRSLLIKCDEAHIQEIKNQALATGKDRTMKLCIALSNAETSIKSAADQRLFIETLFFELMLPREEILPRGENIISQEKQITPPPAKHVQSETNADDAPNPNLPPKDMWKEICNKIKAESPLIYPLLAGCTPLFNNGELTLTFKPFARSYMDKLEANMKILQNAVESLLGKVKIKCELLKDEILQPEKQNQKEILDSTDKDKPKEREQNPDIIEIVKEQFEADIISEN